MRVDACQATVWRGSAATDSTSTCPVHVLLLLGTPCLGNASDLTGSWRLGSGAQLELLQQIAAAASSSKPCILITINAGQLDLAWAKGSASVGAIINAPYLGQTAGSALAATLLGASNPAARLPTTWYKFLSDIGPITDYSMLPAGGKAGRTYRYFDGPVLYPFGERQNVLCPLSPV